MSKPWRVMRRARGSHTSWYSYVDNEFNTLDEAADWCDFSNETVPDEIFWVEGPVEGEESA